MTCLLQHIYLLLATRARTVSTRDETLLLIMRCKKAGAKQTHAPRAEADATQMHCGQPSFTSRTKSAGPRHRMNKCQKSRYKNISCLEKAPGRGPSRGSRHTTCDSHSYNKRAVISRTGRCRFGATTQPASCGLGGVVRSVRLYTGKRSGAIKLRWLAEERSNVSSSPVVHGQQCGVVMGL